HFCEFVRQQFVVAAGAFDGGGEFTRRQRLLRGEQQRFDDLGKTHAAYAPIALWIASAIRFACRSICSSSRPSIRSRIFGSVPEYRSRTRPLPESSFSASPTSLITAGNSSSGGFSFTIKFRCACGYFVRQRFNSLSGFPVVFM